MSEGSITAQYITERPLLQAQEEDIRAAEAAKVDDLEGLPLDQVLVEIEQERTWLHQTS